ncbi:MAG: glutathione peroxidase [Terracidiphilus sp.]|nr:glutathione peroxidase [Terracidiphilus sp.]
MEGSDRTVYRFSAPLLDGHTVALEQFRAQVLLIVNTASQCGFTPQYTGLEQLYRTYKDLGFAVLAFPSNQFGRQEPGSAAEIGAFCETNYRITFPVFAKIDVNGDNAHPLYCFLKQARPGILGAFGSGAIRWNFTKFLIDRQGQVVRRFAPSTNPRSLAPTIEELLQPP